MSKNLIPVTLFSGLSLIAGVAFAAAPVSSTNPERNAVEQAAPIAKTRAEVKMELADFNKSPVSPDGWEFVGGERQWSLIPHRAGAAGGKASRTDKADRATEKPNLSKSREEIARDRELYRVAV